MNTPKQVPAYGEDDPIDLSGVYLPPDPLTERDYSRDAQIEKFYTSLEKAILISVTISCLSMLTSVIAIVVAIGATKGF